MMFYCNCIEVTNGKVYISKKSWFFMNMLQRFGAITELNNGTISPSLFDEIALKLKKISENPQCYDARMRLVKEDLRSMGDVYSFWIENPELRKAYLTEKRQEATLKKQARKGIEAMHNAWYFLNQKGQFGKFIEILDEDILKGVNGLVNGEDKESGRFRWRDVTLNFKGFTPVGWEKVPNEVKKTLEYVKRIGERNPLEAAIYCHLALALTQPFDEGNKRTSRLVQDMILHDAGLPPAIIPAGEAKFYLDLLERSAWPFRNENREGQRQFFDYNASKVNNALDTILNDLDA